MNLKGIDVSHHNGTIDWGKVKAAGVQFAILRCGFGRKSPTQIDTQFERNYRECKRVGIPVGVYHYSYAATVEDAKLEADFMLELISGKQFEYPVVFDIEDKTQAHLGKNLLTEITAAFCDKVEKAGYYTAIYSNPDWLINRLDREKLSRFDLWLAEWRTAKTYTGTHGIWQYTDKGAVNGIVGNVDLDIAYKDYPTIIKKAGLNGFGKTEPKFEVTAAKSGLKSSAADVLSAKLKDLGMTVVKKEESK